MDGLYYYALCLACVCFGAWIGGGEGLLIGLALLACAEYVDDSLRRKGPKWLSIK